MECNTFIAEMHVSSEKKEVEVQSLYQALKKVRDKRARRGMRYQAAVVLTLLILGKLAGETTMRGIAEWIKLREEELAKRLPLWKKKAPCENTYRTICQQSDVGELNEVLGGYFAGVKEKVEEIEAVSATVAAGSEESCPVPVEGEGIGSQKQMALDGKTLRGTKRRGEGGKTAVHTVGLYNVTDGYMWKQVSVVGKGQERKAASTLLEPLELTGTVVSADALHTQPKWAQAVLDRNGHYLLIAKGNQSELHEAIAHLFSQPPRPFLFPEGHARTVDKAHGRLEIRHLRVSAELSDYLAPRWPKVAQVFQIERTITRNGKTTREFAYGLTSLSQPQASPPHLLSLVRQHWHIENRNHWRRDVTLGEDACLVSMGQIPQVLAALNNAVLALVDFTKRPNLAAAMRFFDAFPHKALDLLLLPLAPLATSGFV